MRAKLIEKAEFKEIFDKSPFVCETDYKNLVIAYWVSLKPAIGIKITYRFDANNVMKEYYFIDLTEVYSFGLEKIGLHTFNATTEEIDYQQILIENINKTFDESLSEMVKHFNNINPDTI